MSVGDSSNLNISISSEKVDIGDIDKKTDDKTGLTTFSIDAKIGGKSYTITLQSGTKSQSLKKLGLDTPDEGQAQKKIIKIINEIGASTLQSLSENNQAAQWDGANVLMGGLKDKENPFDPSKPIAEQYSFKLLDPKKDDQGIWKTARRIGRAFQISMRVALNPAPSHHQPQAHQGPQSPPQSPPPSPHQPQYQGPSPSPQSPSPQPQSPSPHQAPHQVHQAPHQVHQAHQVQPPSDNRFKFAENEASIQTNIDIAGPNDQGTNKLPKKRLLKDSFSKDNSEELKKLKNLQQSIKDSPLHLTHDMNPRGDGNCMFSSMGFMLAEGMQQGKITSEDVNHLLKTTYNLLCRSGMHENRYCHLKFLKGTRLLNQLIRNPHPDHLSELLDTHKKHQAFLYMMRMMTAVAMLETVGPIASLGDVGGVVAPEWSADLLKHNKHTDWETSVVFFDKLGVGIDVFIQGGDRDKPDDFHYHDVKHKSREKIDGVALLRIGDHYHALWGGREIEVEHNQAY